MFFSIGLILLIGFSQHIESYSTSQLVRDAALDVLESLTKLAETGLLVKEDAKFYSHRNVSTEEIPSLGPIPLNGRQRECDQSDRQVTTVDNNAAQVCCVSQSQSTTCKKLQCSKVVDNCCLRMDNGARDTLCSGVVGAQRVSLPAFCQQRGLESTILVHRQENKASS